MDFLKCENFAYFIALFLPGFISVKVYHSIVAHDNYDFSKNVFEIVGYSFINFLLNIWVVLLGISNDWLVSDSVWLYVAAIWMFLISPVLWPILLDRLLSRKFFRRYLLGNKKSSWDYYFNLRVSVYMIVHLKGGERIGGLFGTRSYASRYPCKESIYLEEAWLLRDLSDVRKFKERVAHSAGLLILNENIEYIEFFTT